MASTTPGLPRQHRLFVAVLLAPALLVIAGVVVYPFLLNLVLSFSNASLYHLRDWELTGVGQYRSVFAEPRFWEILGKSVLWTVVNVVFHVGIGVTLAVFLHQKFVRGKGAWRVMLILPWALPQYITALTWRGMFNAEYGAINLALAKFFGMSPIDWLGSPVEAFSAIVLTNVWLGFPFMMVVALGGLQSIPDSLYEAADVDGASAWQQFRTITLPMLAPVLWPAITLGMVWTFNNVNVVWLVTNGGEPDDRTHILVSYVYRAAFTLYRFSWAAALSLVIFVILFTFAQLMRRKEA